MNDAERDEERPRKPNLWQIIGSVLAAGFGVQSSRNRERDFKHGRAAVFLVMGVVFTALFVAAIYGVVNLVLSGSGQ